MSLGPYLRLFRVVNLPTVPGDVLVGAAAVIAGSAFSGSTAVRLSSVSLVAAILAGVSLYLFGLVDNDLVGAATDAPDRPIPSGEVPVGVARLLRGFFLGVTLAAGCAANLPTLWWCASFSLVLSVVLYNRTKSALLMGLCRGFDVLCGGAALVVGSWRGVPSAARLNLLAFSVLMTLYVAGVTRYSEGEESDPARRRRVGFLLGALVYLQLVGLVVFFEVCPIAPVRNLLLAEAALLLIHRFVRRACPKVSAS